MSRIELTVGGFKITLVQRRFETTAQYYAKTRVYVADKLLETDPTYAALSAAESFLGDRRFAEHGTDAAVDSLYDTLNRTITRLKRETARTFLEALHGENTDEVFEIFSNNLFSSDIPKIRFSRTAGCSCPCSPGCVVDRTYRAQGVPVDMWVEDVAV